MSDSYFVITTSEDGIYLQQLTHEKMLEAIHYEDEYVESERPLRDAVAELPRDVNNLQRGGIRCCIIKGRLVVPKPIEVVTKFEIE